MDGRVVQARQERRRVIMAAAAGLFAACGYRAASMEEIACRAGISKPVLYKSFSSKLELYLAVLHEAIQVLDDTLTAALDRADGLRSIVAASVAAVFDFADTHARSAALLAGAAVADEPSAQRLAHQAATICTDALSRALAPYPFPRPEQGWLITAELVAIAQSCARDWVATGKPLPKHEAVATTASLCWTGLAGVQLAPKPANLPADRLPVSDTPA
ncbi:TetR/AcrR family transcriptional regulator [Nocardia veterana]|uniref:TetR/AcrR family transcriptional regulator n=2 Tax=Nocardia veterana TaxID=132249 RepID=A0A7X6M0P7_9NOCA|nr:TetR/AcrR family transcriptional regulator [Nocardia veterana]NKY88134.1 TetR/AcrR family transcriptional regulator [Nocardia veterana]